MTPAKPFQATMLEGTWRVEREGGVIPPFGLSKRIAGGRRWTLAAGMPAAPFRVVGSTSGALSC